MKKLRFSFIIFILVIHFSCQPTERKKAILLIQKAIEAHGGQENWENLQSFSLEKKVWVYDENGTLESNLVQQQDFRLKPYFEALLKWEKDSVNHRLIFDGLKTEYWMGENQIRNEGFLQSQKKELDAAFNVLNKPFDLIDKQIQCKYLGKMTLADGQTVESIQVIKGKPVEANPDVWWYYFSPETFRLVAYKEKTSDHINLFYYREYDSQTGIIFPAKSEIYRVDSLGRHLYLRAVYENGKYSLSD